ncbi:MAG: leucyl/phenylalanyl-tRNA--protein transferase [Bacteroidia bacterium]
MPVFAISKNELRFPDPRLADDEGLLAVGGDLSTERLLLAYSHGIFPWFSEGQPVLWWSPDPRFVLYPSKLKISRSLKQVLRQKKFTVTFDQDFSSVIKLCKKAERPGQDGTWITKEMQQAYIRLHEAGFAHSVEVWYEKELAGGLYGVSLGACFSGESMFHLQPDASKVALFYLAEQLKRWDFRFIDCQVYTPHLERMGAEEIPRNSFLYELKAGINMPTKKDTWSKLSE